LGLFAPTTVGQMVDGVGQAGQQTGSALAPNPLQSQPQPLQGAVFGGNIIGVGSKIKESSLRVYEGGDTCEKWEFISNPQQQVAIPGQQPVNPNAPLDPIVTMLHSDENRWMEFSASTKVRPIVWVKSLSHRHRPNTGWSVELSLGYRSINITGRCYQRIAPILKQFMTLLAESTI